MTVEQSPAAPLPPGVEDQSLDVIHWKPVGVAVFGSLVLFAIGAVFAVWLLKTTNGSATMEDQKPVPFAGAPQVGIVEQRLVELENRAQLVRTEQKKQLGEYGWIDRNRQLVHVPIEQGMQAVVEGKR